MAAALLLELSNRTQCDPSLKTANPAIFGCSGPPPQFITSLAAGSWATTAKVIVAAEINYRSAERSQFVLQHGD